jgi:hypothetical protein
MPIGFTSPRLAVLRAAGAGRLEGDDDGFVICRTHALDEDVSEEAAGALADGQIELSSIKIVECSGFWLRWEPIRDHNPEQTAIFQAAYGAIP